MTTAEPDRDDITAARDRLLEASLPHVVFDGWGLKALLAGAADLGLGPGHVHGVFVNPNHDPVVHFADWADRRMLARLETMDLQHMKVRDRIAAAVRVRLEELAEHKEATRRAIAVLARPRHGGDGARILYRSVDAIWRAAGDSAVDFNFYTKRALLAGVLASTTLCWLGDRSADHAGTWAFLERRIADVMRIPAWQSRLRNAVETLNRPRALRKRAGKR